MITENLTQQLAVATFITPAAARNTGSYVSPAVDASLFKRLAAYLHVGTLAGTGTVNLRFQHCSVSASSAAAWADINSTTCITSTLASTSNDRLAQLELRLDQNPTVSQFVRVLASVATSNGWVGGATVLGEPIYKPATDRDTADVVQTVVF